MNILCVIPARGGSKRVKNKNIMDLMGKPVIGYTIEAALKSKLINKIAVSTDDKAIMDTVKKLYTVEVIARPPEYAKDDSPIEEALLHSVEYMKNKYGYETDIVVWLQANVPIRKEGLIDEVISKLIDDPDADSSVTCYEADQNPEVMKIINSKGRLEPIEKNVLGVRKQEFRKRFLLDGSVIAIKAANLYKTKGIRRAHVYLCDNVIPVIQSERMYSLEIDTYNDYEEIKYYLTKFNAK